MVPTRVLMCGAALWTASALTGCHSESSITVDSGGPIAVEAVVEVPATSPPAQEAKVPVATPIMVEVQGAVMLPGHYAFPDDARVFDALTKAGGATEAADITDINIAAALLDGSVLSVPYRPTNDASPPPLTAALLNPPVYTRSGWRSAGAEGRATVRPGPTASTPSPIDLNTANREQLESLPGVGPKTADKIIAFRNQQPFASVDDLRHVSGIGDKRLETLRPMVTVHH